MESLVKKESPRILDWMNVLSKEHGMLLFEAAKTGIKASKTSGDTFGLTRKQYYTRLAELSECELVSKVGDTYLHTELGRLVFGNVLGLQKLERKDNKALIGMVQSLMETKRFDEEAINKVRANYSL